MRATHRKTLELAREPEITERATCVVGVRAAIDEDALTALRGRVELTIAAGGRSAAVRGRLNPAFHPGDPLIVRRAGAVTRNAVVVDADTVAADLDRELVAALAVAGAEVELRFASVDEPSPGALIVGRAGARLDTFSRYRGQKCPTVDLEVRSPVGEADAARARSALADGARVSLIAAVDDENAAALIAEAHDAGHAVLPADGLEPAEAVRAVAGLSGDAVVETMPAERLPKTLRRSGATRGAIGLDLGTPREQFLPWRAGAPLDIPGARGRTATVALAQPRTPDTSSVSRPDPRTSR